jgi:hypothetical protein
MEDVEYDGHGLPEGVVFKGEMDRSGWRLRREVRYYRT